MGPVASGGRFPLWSPHPSPTQALASCLPGDVWQERVARLGGWVGVVRSISLYPPLRVTGCLATCLFLARCPGPGHPLAHPRTRPRSHAAMQTVSVAWKFRSRGCPGRPPDGERCAPAESAPAGSLGVVWRTVRFGGGCAAKGGRWRGSRGEGGDGGAGGEEARR